ncbi:hypothetical protein LJK88_20115 [Paenibacillus sp. P26]|nr:hypothetical protein LJK88_20115 [Paenibacillus sp. P26]
MYRFPRSCSFVSKARNSILSGFSRFFFVNGSSGDLEPAVDLVFQSQQRIDAGASKANDEHRIVNRIDAYFLADDPASEGYVESLDMFSYDGFHGYTPPVGYCLLSCNRYLIYSTVTER